MKFQKGHKINKGRRLSQAHRDKIKSAMMNRKITWGKKISQSKQGHTWPKGYNERQSLAQKKRFQNETVWNKGMGCGSKLKRDNEKEYAKQKEWRDNVLKRDRYQCVNCKSNKSLEADHIKMWAVYPKLRYEISNGQTLCQICHKQKTAKDLSIYWKNQFAQSRNYNVMTDQEYNEAWAMI